MLKKNLRKDKDEDKMKKDNKKSNNRDNIAKSIFLASFNILIFIFLNIFLTSTLFIFKVSVSKVIPIVSLLLALGIVLYILKKNNLLNVKNWLSICISVLLPILIIGCSIFLSGKLYDYSYDGNTYHKNAIGELKDGWNPVYESVEEFDKASDLSLGMTDNSGLWINHYARASHVYAANIYALTGNIETGKSINILSIIVLFGFCLSMLLYKGKSLIFSILFSIAVITYPVISSQYLTNYVDLLLYIYLTLTLLSFAFFENKKIFSDNILLSMYMMFLVIAINIKFTAFAYAGIFCLGYFIWYLFRLKKKQLDKKFFKKFFAISVISVIIGAIVVGWGVYPKNLIDHGHPFYPIMGKDKVDIMTANSPDYFKEKSSAEKFLISTFSEVDNIYEALHTEAKFKVPFMVMDNEVTNLYGTDTRISGNGVFFSGILILSLLFIAIYIYKVYKKNRTLFYLTVIPLGITIIMIFVLQESWWARYYPQLYFIVLIALLYCDEVKSETSRALQYILMGILLINNYQSFGANSWKAYENTVQINSDYFQMENASCDKIDIYNNGFLGETYNIIDKFGYKNINIKDYEEFSKNENSELMINNHISWKCGE